jgi:RNA polymerase sigma-70 factor, ECF subfamily
VDKRQELWELYSAKRQSMYAYALALTGSAPAAEDVVHDAVVSVAKTNGAVRRLEPYLFRCIRNEALRVRAGHQPAAPMDAPDSPSGTSSQPDALAAEHEIAMAVWRALDALPPMQREVIVLRAFSRLRFREIAAVVDKPLPTVAAYYRRGLQRLATLLEDLR